MKPCFLLDENINKSIQRQLCRMGQNIKVLAVGDTDAPPKGTSDPELLLWMEENGYILVTENRSTIPGHIADHFSAGRHFPGVFWIRPNVAAGAVAEELYLIWLASEAEEYLDCTLYIPL
ncbi:MAG: hypothetical protein BWK80_13795 [Desulfobacteraceae bacterium IS3]|nr:MAG: hypothetical protein BWK80_13795 [Desulfobacteraceae bacterium IS3]